MKTSAALLCAVVGLAAVLGPPALADRDHDRARDALARGDILALEEILPGVQARFGARLLEVELEQERDRLVYEMDLITPAGRIIEVLVDASSGAVIDHDGDGPGERD